MSSAATAAGWKRSSGGGTPGGDGSQQQAHSSSGDAGAITAELIKRTTGEYDLEMVQWLDLSSCGIRKIEGLGPCTGLLDLCLASNRVREIEGLEGLSSLTRLDLSCNRIQRIGGLEKLGALEYLDLKGNQIGCVDDVSTLAGLPRLRHFFMKEYSGERANPACNHPAYHMVVTRHLQHLQILDGESLNLRQCMADAVLESVQADPDALAPLPPERWCGANDWALTPVDVVVDDALKEGTRALQEALQSCNDARATSGALLKELGEPPITADSAAGSAGRGSYSVTAGARPPQSKSAKLVKGLAETPAPAQGSMGRVARR